MAVLNTYLHWPPASFEALLSWLASDNYVVVALPQILILSGQVERLIKRDPSFIALCSLRFVSQWLKPAWLRCFDSCFTMDDQNFNAIF